MRKGVWNYIYIDLAFKQSSFYVLSLYVFWATDLLNFLLTIFRTYLPLNIKYLFRGVKKIVHFVFFQRLVHVRLLIIPLFLSIFFWLCHEFWKNEIKLIFTPTLEVKIDYKFRLLIQPYGNKIALKALLMQKLTFKLICWFGKYRTTLNFRLRFHSCGLRIASVIGTILDLWLICYWSDPARESLMLCFFY